MTCEGVARVKIELQTLSEGSGLPGSPGPVGNLRDRVTLPLHEPFAPGIWSCFASKA
jgi:hypothetical protein